MQLRASRAKEAEKNLKKEPSFELTDTATDWPMLGMGGCCKGKKCLKGSPRGKWHGKCKMVKNGADKCLQKCQAKCDKRADCTAFTIFLRGESKWKSGGGCALWTA